jgi:hypothetical protein
VHAIEDIASIARDNAARTESTSKALTEQQLSLTDMADAAHRLAMLARALRERIALFRLPPAELDARPARSMAPEERV